MFHGESCDQHAFSGFVLLNAGVKVDSISLFGAPVDNDMIGELRSKEVQVNVHNNDGDTTAIGNQQTLSIGLRLLTSTARRAHGTYFRSDLEDSVHRLLEWGVR